MDALLANSFFYIHNLWSGLKRIFFKGIKHGGKIPLARVGKQNNDTLPLVLRVLKKSPFLRTKTEKCYDL